MRKLLFILILALCAPAWGAAAYVQQVSGFAIVSASSYTFAFASNIASTDGVACLLTWTGVTTITSLVDGNSAGYTTIDGPLSYTPFNTTYSQTFILTNNAGGTGSKSLTATWPSAATDLIYNCHEASGVSTTSGLGAVDVHALSGQTNPGTGTNAVTTTGVITTGADYLFGASNDTAIQTDTWTAGTSPNAFTLRSAASAGQANESFVLTTGASGTVANFTIAQSIAGPVTALIAIKPAGGGGGSGGFGLGGKGGIGGKGGVGGE